MKKRISAIKSWSSLNEIKRQPPGASKTPRG